MPVPSDPRLLKPELDDPRPLSPLLEPDMPLVNDPKLDVVCRFLVVAVEERLVPVPDERPSSPVVPLELVPVPEVRPSSPLELLPVPEDRPSSPEVPLEVPPRLSSPPVLPELLVGIERDGMLIDGNEAMESDPLNWRFSTSMGAAVARSAQPATVIRERNFMLKIVLKEWYGLFRNKTGSSDRREMSDS